MSFEKGDLIGVLREDAAIAYVITKVIKEDRFYFAYSIITKRHQLIVHDPATCFMICPGFNPKIQPDQSMDTISTEMYSALERLFGFFDAEDVSFEFNTDLLLDDEEDTED